MSDETDRKFIEIWAVENYDEIVGRYPDEITCQEAREIFALEYEAAVKAGDIPRVPQDEP